jgi:signal transduction histidine kinase
MHALLVAQSQVLALTRMVEEQRQAAEAANRSKSEFLANISHELRTPLHGIASYARFGRDEVDSAEPAELLTYFAQIEQCTDTLLHLVNDLLDLSKMEAGKMRFDKQEAILSDLIEGVVDEFNSLCAERDLRVVYTPAERETFLFLDPERIKQVVRNLLSNAVKFSSPGGRVTVRLRRVGNVLLMSVCDQGPGIPPEELETIFDKFVQSSKTKSGSGGTGLGLAICREIVMGHEGRIWAENNQGPGATFYCELPLSRDPVAEEVCEDADGAVIV